MKIKSIEYENFRNFRDHGQIRCSTDGKMTIVYGKNGDGKTTLHQLFQWVIYGTIKFNKTATDRLYNLAMESEQPYGAEFNVMGRVDFEHDGINYSITRTVTYKKGISDSAVVKEDFSLQQQNENYDWLRVDRPTEKIEKMLPSGLSEYFFFDGESMIADLRVKSRDSAGKLRKALYSMFDLDVVESAIGHIGRTDLRSTVLGKLYLSKSSVASGTEISVLKTNIENAQKKIADLESKKSQAEEESKKLQERITAISEEIGSTKSKQEYEHQRAELKKQRDLFDSNAKKAQQQFGDVVLDAFPPILISRAVAKSKVKLQLMASSETLPNGITEPLISYLTRPDTNVCVCGRPLCSEEKEHVRSYLKLMPPRSYASMYQNFCNTSEHMGGRVLDKGKIESAIKSVLDNNESALSCDKKIAELDKEQAQSRDIEDLVVDRRKAEARVQELAHDVATLKSQIDQYNIYLKKNMAKYDKATTNSAEAAKVASKIAIMERVLAHFTEKLESASKEYSSRLQENIQDLLNDMLTSKRTVSVTKDFAVSVTDSFQDESKSEGQFAIVSFAYIGGILKMLREDEALREKEYPLVLDGPFSKLDPDMRQNVVNALPRFAPQVIIFSKDDLHDVVNPEDIGSVWTIVSNEEKNIAIIKEGKLWK